MDSDGQQDSNPSPEPVALQSSILTGRPIWHDDGDIVLRVTAGDVTKLFRVHQVYLRKSSDIFRDMFSMAQPSDGSEAKIEGCPVIPLDDSPEDLYALLTAVYDGLAMLPPDRLTLDSALRILLLSDKYGMEGLRKGIVRVLQEDWPLNRTDYINRRRQLDLKGYRVDESIKVIMAARKSNVSELLPTAFYELAASLGSIQSQTHKSIFSQLSSEDLSCLLFGSALSMQRLRKLGEISFDQRFLWSPVGEPVSISTHRTSFVKCSTFPFTICPKFSSSFPIRVGQQHFMGKSAVEIAEVLRNLSWFPDLCSGCAKWLVPVLENKEKEIWENIPVDFGLPPIDPKYYSESMFKMR